MELRVSPCPADSWGWPSLMTGLPSMKSLLIVGRNSSGLAECLSALSEWWTGGVSPLIETSPSSEEPSQGEQDLWQSTSNLLPNRWKQPEPSSTLMWCDNWWLEKQSVSNAQSAVTFRRLMFCWTSLPTIKLSAFLRTHLLTRINIMELNQATEVKLFRFPSKPSYLFRLHHSITPSLYYSTRPEITFDFSPPHKCIDSRKCFLTVWKLKVSIFHVTALQCLASIIVL